MRKCLEVIECHGRLGVEDQKGLESMRMLEKVRGVRVGRSESDRKS